MEYQGRSPFKDVARSVIMGAAMIPAAVLAGCSRSDSAPASNPPTSGGWQNAQTDPNGTGATAAAGTDAATALPTPPPEARPRPPTTGGTGTPTSMPTRGFSGGARVRG